MTGLERELINSLKKGNSKSFELIFKTYYPRLCVFAFHYTKQLESAEDLVKDVFVSIWNNHKNLEIKTSLSGYLFRSIRNSCINYLERDKNHNNLSIEEMGRLNIKIQEPLSEDYLMGKILANELEEQIFSEIEKLPDSCKEIFKLSRFEGLPHKKIAEKLNISENTVKSQIYNGLKKLKEALSSKSIVLFNFFSKK
jgi:RNA polymerase sigma-70 factor (ECF subfamily)